MATRRSNRPKALCDRAVLYHAVVEQEKKAIIEILQHDIDWSLRDDNGETVLHLAFERKDNSSREIIEILEIFLDLGMNVNAKNSIGKTVMHLAVRDKLKDVIEFLLKRGGDLNIRDGRGNSIAHFLVDTEFKRFRECVFAYGSPDYRNMLERESVELIYWLTSQGLDVECPNNMGVTALQLALRRNLQHVLPIFLKHAKDISFVDEHNRTILHVFLEKNGLYKDYTRQNKTKKVAIPSFFYGTEYGTNIVQILLDKGVSVDLADKDGNTPLHIAGKVEESDILEMMLDRFTNVQARNQHGETVLHVVIAECMDYAGLYFDEYVEVVRTLISKGADVHACNNDGQTIVQLAAMQKHLGVLQVLKEHSADFRVLTGRRENLLHLVSANMMEMVSDKTYEKMLELLVSEGCDVNGVDDDEVSPLHVAAKYGSLAVVKQLLKHGALVDRREKAHQLTPLHLAVEFNHIDVIEELVRAGSDVNAKDVFGITALHRAAGQFTGESMKLLLRLGANVDVQDKDGYLPLDVAIERNNPAGVEELLRYGADINDTNTLRAIVMLNNNYMYTLLLDHWYKLKAIGLPCADDYMYYNEEDFKIACNGCTQEIQELKCCMIDKRTSLYDLLHMNRNQKCFYVKNNEVLEDMINSSLVESKFPKYHVLIEACYREALARRQLFEPAKSAWYRLTNIFLPDICLEKILDNLSNVHLRRMIDGIDDVKLKRSLVRATSKTAKKRRTK